jgi:hypothetical protein
MRMITYSTRIQQFKAQGGWSYIEVSRRQAEQLNPGCRKSFRVKGTIDQHKIQKTSLLPMGEGAFMLPVNAAIRKGTGKKAGDTVKVHFEVDKRTIPLSADLISCLKDEPQAYTFFKTLSKSHQGYFSKWIEDAKTTHTKTKRITMAIIALASGQGFPEMVRANRKGD